MICLCVIAAAIELLETCSGVLQQCNEVLFEVLFTLAQDEWPQVSSLCQSWLTAWLPKHTNSASQVRELCCATG